MKSSSLKDSRRTRFLGVVAKEKGQTQPLTESSVSKRERSPAYDGGDWCSTTGVTTCELSHFSASPPVSITCRSKDIHVSQFHVPIKTSFSTSSLLDISRLCGTFVEPGSESYVCVMHSEWQEANDPLSFQYHILNHGKNH
jgi:hypothetical protein